MDIATIWVLGAGLAIGLAGLGVGLGEWQVAQKSLEVIGKNPDLKGFILVLTVLGIALVESAAIYSLIVAFGIMGAESVAEGGPAAINLITAGIAIGLAGMGAGIGEGKLVASAMDAVQRNPEVKGAIMTNMVLFLALVESVAIYGLIVAMSLI